MPPPSRSGGGGDPRDASRCAPYTRPEVKQDDKPIDWWSSAALLCSLAAMMLRYIQGRGAVQAVHALRGTQTAWGHTPRASCRRRPLQQKGPPCSLQALPWLPVPRCPLTRAAAHALRPTGQSWRRGRPCSRRWGRWRTCATLRPTPHRWEPARLWQSQVSTSARLWERARGEGRGAIEAPVGMQGHVGSVLGVRERRRAAAEGRSCENRVSAACGHPGAGLLVCVSISKAAAT